MSKQQDFVKIHENTILTEINFVFIMVFSLHKTIYSKQYHILFTTSDKFRMSPWM